MPPQSLKLFRNGFAILVLLAVPAISNASQLKQETLNAWDDYLRTTNLRMHRNLGTGHPFLWIEEEPSRRQRVRQGEILISPARETSPQQVHDGLIHDWIGAIFIPGVRINDVFAVVHCISYSTRVQEIKDNGQRDSHKLPTDEGHGYIWRLYSLTKFEERDGGVYIVVEAIALSRDVSASVRWFTKPVLERVSRNSMSTILRLTRDAVRSNIAACGGTDLKACNYLEGNSSR